MKNTPAPNFELEVPLKWKWHCRALLRFRGQLLKEQEDRRAALRVPMERGGADEGDTAADRSERDDLLAEFYSERAEIEEIDAALDRMRLGTYGCCEVTGQEISEARLRAIPWTRLSHAAAAQRDRSKISFGPSKKP